MRQKNVCSKEAPTLAKESLDQSTVWSSIASTYVECFPDCHESYDGIKEERSDLINKVNEDREAKYFPTKKPVQ